MADNESRKIDSIFLNALEKQTDKERAAYLDSACGDAPELRQRVERLLKAYPKAAGSFLESPPSGVGRTIDVDPAALNAGLSPAFGGRAAVVVGSAGHSVLKSLGKRLPDVPHVSLHDSREESKTIVQPRSPEMPQKDEDGRYQFLGEIARGGMGAIIKGRDTDLGRDLAIKVLLDSHKEKPEVVQRFVEEAQIGGQLQHPGIVPVYELGELGDQRPFFSMKLVKGETLAALLTNRKDRSDDLPKLLGVFEQVCQTMAYAHSKGVIHRDLKPANIMVGAFGEVQVMDWGLSKVLRAGGIADEEKSLNKHREVSTIHTRRSTGSDGPGEIGSQTQMGSVMGTPAYMPPEQALGEVDRLDERADVFGLGAILCEILTGKPPYVGEDSTDVFRRASRAKLDDCFKRIEQASRDNELTKLTLRALAPEPEDRYRDASAFADEVTKYLVTVQERAERAKLQLAEAKARAAEERGRHKLYFAIAGLMLAIAVGSIATAAVFRRQREVQADMARANKHLADDNDTKRRAAERAREAEQLTSAELRQQLLVSRVMRLAAHSRSSRDERPIQSLLLAMESVESTRRQDQAVTPLARETLMNAMASIDGWPLTQESAETVAASANGRWLVAGTTTGDVKLWNMSATRLPTSSATFRGHSDAVVSVAISPDSRWVATASHDGTARLWDLTDFKQGQSSRSIVRQEQPLLCVAFGPDGRWVAAGSDDGTVHLAHFTDGQLAEPIVLRGHTKFVKSLVISRDGRWLVTGSRDGTARRWDLRSTNVNENPSLMPGPNHPFGIYCIGVTPDSSRLFAAGSRRFGPGIRSWKLDAEDPASSLRQLPETAFVWTMAVSPDGRWLASTADNLVRLWDLTADDLAKPEATLHGHTKNVHALIFTSDSDRLITAGTDMTARIWDVSASDPESNTTVLRGHDSNIKAVAVGANDKWLATGGSDGVRLWNLKRTEPAFPTHLLRGHEDAITCLAVSRDGRWLATGSRDHTVWLWKLLDGQPTSPAVLRGHSASIRSVALSSDGSWLLSGSEDTTACLWNLDDPDVASSPRVLSGNEDAVGGVLFSRDGRLAITRGFDGTVRVWDVTLTESGPSPIILRASDGGGISSARITPNSRWLISSSFDSTARIWDLKSPRPEDSATVLKHDNILRAAAISVDGRWVITGKDHVSDKQKAALLWQVNANQQVASSRYIGQEIESLTVDADGRWVLIRSDSNADLIDLAADDPLQSMRRIERLDKRIESHAVSADGRLMLTQAGPEVFLWDLMAEDPVATAVALGIHDEPVTGIAFSPDTQWAITASRDKTVCLWDLDISTLVERAKRLAGRRLTAQERDYYRIEDDL